MKEKQGGVLKREIQTRGRDYLSLFSGRPIFFEKLVMRSVVCF